MRIRFPSTQQGVRSCWVADASTASLRRKGNEYLMGRRRESCDWYRRPRRRQILMRVGKFRRISVLVRSSLTNVRFQEMPTATLGRGCVETHVSGTFCVSAYQMVRYPCDVRCGPDEALY